MKKFTSVVLIAALTTTLAASLTACGSTQNQSQQSSQAEAAQQTSVTQYPVTITTYDASGREITQTFDKAPERIVTNNLSATETLIELGLGDKIVGMMNPDNTITSKYKDSIEKINKLGDKKSISKEVILSAAPDIVVGRAAMFSEKSLGAYTDWNNNGINVYAQGASVTTGNVELTSVIQDVKNLGIIFNVQDKANAYADELQKKYDAAVAKAGSSS